MKKKKVIAFTIAGDQENLKFYKGFRNSLRKFHSEKELPLKLYGPEQVNAFNDSTFYYRATPKIAAELIEEYETVIKFDVDQIVMGDLSHTWKHDYDLGVVQNSNPREIRKQPVTVWDIDAPSYVNAGFVVMKNEKIISHWNKLCHSPVFKNYQYREQY